VLAASEAKMEPPTIALSSRTKPATASKSIEEMEDHFDELARRRAAASAEEVDLEYHGPAPVPPEMRAAAEESPPQPLSRPDTPELLDEKEGDTEPPARIPDKWMRGKARPRSASAGKARPRSAAPLVRPKKSRAVARADIDASVVESKWSGYRLSAGPSKLPRQQRASRSWKRRENEIARLRWRRMMGWGSDWGPLKKHIF
jgi:hypothetical protein